MADPWMSQGVPKLFIGYFSSFYLSFCILANQTHCVRYFCRGSNNDRNGPVADAVRVKPNPRDSIPVKEKFIQAKVCAIHNEIYCGTVRVDYSWHFELFGSWLVVGCE